MALSKVQLEQENQNNFPDNTQQLITPQLLREFNTDMIDSLVDENTYNADSASWNAQIAYLDPSGSIIALNALEAFTASAEIRLNALEQTSQSLNQFTASQAVSNSYFATTGSNTFTGNQTIAKEYHINTNGIYWNDSTVGYNNLEIINSGYGNVDIAALNGRVRIVNSPLTLTGSALTSSNDISTSANIYGANLLTSAITASSIVTASVSQSTITFTKGDGSQFNIVVADVSGSQGSFVTTASFNQYTQSTDNRLNSIQAFTASVSTSVGLLQTFSSSQYKADSASFDSRIIAAENTGYVTTASFNAYTASQDFKNTTFATTSSVNSLSASIFSTDATQSSLINGKLDTSSFTTFSTSVDSRLDLLELSGSGFATTASVNALSASIYQTDSTQSNAITNNSSSFATSISASNFNITNNSASVAVTINNLSSSIYQTDATQSNNINSLTLKTGSYATTGSNTFIGNQTINGDISASGNISASSLYATNATIINLTTIYETSSVIYSSGSNQFGDELSDVQILSGSVKVVGGLTVNGVSVSTQSVDISSLNAFTASQIVSNSYFATTSSVNDLSASIYETDSTQSNNISNNSSSIGVLQTNVNSLTSQTSSYAISSSVKVVTDGLQNQINTLATTSSVNDLSASIYSTDSTQSNNISSNSSSIGLLQTFSGSQYKADSSSFDSRINSAGGNVSVQEEGSILGNATSFNFIGAGVTATLSSGTASVTIPGGGGSIDTGSFATTGSNTFVGTQTLSGSKIVFNQTGSNNNGLAWNTGGSIYSDQNKLNFAAVEAGLDFVVNGTTSNDVQFRNTSPSGGIQFSANGGQLRLLAPGNSIEISGSGGTFIQGVNFTTYSSSVSDRFNSQDFKNTTFATTGSNTFFGQQTISGSNLRFNRTGSISTNGIQFNNASIYQNNFLNFETQGNVGVDFSANSATDSGVNINFRNTNNNGDIQFTTTNGNISLRSDGSKQVSLSGSAIVLNGVNFNTFSASVDSRLLASTINTSSFATTGSNTFTGQQTLSDVDRLNQLTLDDHSGSLVLYGKGFTSSSLSHVTATSVGVGNIIFKTNNNTSTTIVSGSNNLFVNAGTPTAGFTRYIGGSGNIMLGQANVPQISSSMTISPTMNNNYFGGNNTTLTMRGPISSSAWTIAGNTNIGTIQIGSSDANNARGIQSGLTLTGNTVAGTLTVIANSQNLSSSVSITNTVLNGNATINAFSSSVSLAFNTINDNGFTLNNAFFSGSAGVGSVALNRNTIGGQSQTITLIGGQPAGTTNATSYSDNAIFGGSNTIFSDVSSSRVVSTNAYHSAIRNVIGGTNLIVSASSALADVSSFGSAYFGRYNANDGIRNKTSDIVFAVGTGTSTTRKTGFLIDSGSNTFIEGSLNVSGSLLLNGTSNLITTGSAISASQAISGGFEFNTKYTTANGYVTQVGGGTTLEISYGDIFNGTKNGNDFIFWLDTNFAGVSVTGSGITNGAITGYNYGAGVEVSITTGTITNGATYTFTGPAQGIVEVTGSLHATKELVVNGAYDARKAVADANGFYSVDASGLVQAGASIDGGAYAGNNSNGNYINLAATSSQVNSNSGPTPFDKPQIAVTQNNNGRFTQISFQGNNDYTDGRITSHQPFEVSSSMDFYAHGHKQFNVGAFQSDVTQSGSANVSQSVNFETTDISQGVSIVSGSRITIANTGTYNIQFSAQVDRVAGSGTDTAYFWLKKNGTNVANTAGVETISGGALEAKTIAAWNYVVDAAANDYYELVWQTTDTNIHLTAITASGNIPAIPSVILTVTQAR